MVLWSWAQALPLLFLMALGSNLCLRGSGRIYTRKLVLLGGGGVLTFSLDLEGRADQGEESGIEGDRAVTVQGHVHAHESLWGQVGTCC